MCRPRTLWPGSWCVLASVQLALNSNLAWSGLLGVACFPRALSRCMSALGAGNSLAIALQVVHVLVHEWTRSPLQAGKVSSRYNVLHSVSWMFQVYVVKQTDAMCGFK